MKKTVKLIALICALLTVISLAACGKNASSSSASDEDSSSEISSSLSDYEWVKFEMPENFTDVDESPAYVTVEDNDDNHHLIKIFKGSIYSGKTFEDMIEKENEYSNNVTVKDAFEVNGRSWTPAYFDFNERSVKLFTQTDDATYSYLIVYDHLEDDEAVQTILNSIEFDVEKFS